MRPLYLEINSFGPYAGREALDFRLLEDRSLFLICGPTGAGKTTVLDAMCYALYNDTSGVRTGAHMRSEYASPQEVTSVSFRFAVGEKCYRVERQPEQEVAKKRGEGMRRMPAAAALYETDGDGRDIRVITAKNVTHEVERLLGFESRQFRQVVLLPQGDFRKLLLASSADRQKIMQTLFQTQKYERFQEKLRQRRNNLEQADSERKARVAQALAAAELETEAAVAPEKEKSRCARKRLEGELKTAETERDAYEKIVQTERTLAEHFVNLDGHRQTLQQLKEKGDEMERRRVYIERLRQAALFAEPFKTLKELKREGQEKKGDLDALAKHTAEAKSGLERDKAALANLRAREEERNRRHREQTELDLLLPKIRDFKVKAETVRKAEILAAAAEREYEKEKTAFDAAREDLDKLRKEADTCRSAAAEAEKAANLADTLAERVRGEEEAGRLQQEIAECTARCSRLAAEVEPAAAAAAEKERIHKKMRIAFLQGQAARLAQELEENLPCPVCGSTTHPKPACMTDDIPMQADVEGAEKEAKEAEAKRNGTVMAYTEAQAECRAKEDAYKVLRERLPGDGTAEDWKKRLDAAKKDHAAAQEKAVRYEKLLQRISEAEATVREGEKRIDAQKAARDGQNRDVIAARSVAAQLQKDIPAAYRDEVAAKERRAFLQQAVKDYDEAVKALEETVRQGEKSVAADEGKYRELEGHVVQLRRRYGEDQTILKERVIAAGFASLTECQGFWQEEDRIAAEQEIYDAYKRELHRLEGMVANEVKFTEGQVRPDMTVCEGELNARNLRCKVLTGEVERVKAREDDLGKLEKRLAAWQAEQVELAAAYKTVGNLYDLVSGERSGVSFERYVLGALLDEVLQAANLRLVTMSRNRYSLQRSHSWDDKRVRKIGLDIEVFDQYTGYARPANTLSGGESFLASMALALGLADVVQAYSGGIHLDTIFIDEGFGTLDSETLDFALNVLVQLKESGRLVGIISHVPELKERITTRLVVTKTERGSKAAFEIL